MSTQISWADKTWEVTAGCSKISPGEVRLLPHNLDKPLHWRKPRRIFVDSRSDLFHEDVPDEYIDRVIAAIASSQPNQFLVLTKRAERMRDYMIGLSERGKRAQEAYMQTGREHFQKYKERFTEGYTLPEPPTPELRAVYDSARIAEHGAAQGFRGRSYSGGEYHWQQWPLSNLWLGVTAENQEQADARIPHLLATPAAVRFVSVEPMLSAVDLRAHLTPAYVGGMGGVSFHTEPGLDWTVCGGESGPGARPMELQWARDLRDQCMSAGVPFFLKQMAVDGKLVHMPELDGRVWEQYPNP
jgi:protein gp37